MSFDDELRAHLERLDEPTPPRPAPSRRIDVDDLRAHFVERLREREEKQPRRVEHLHKLWTPRLGDFARYLESLPARRAATDDAGASDLARRALDRALDWGAPDSLVERLELDEIVAGFEAHGGELRTYALETGLVQRHSSGGVRLTDLGRVFLRLRGKDAVRWLLVVETIQSRGAWDAHRAPRELLEQAMSPRAITLEADHEGEESFGFARSTLERLSWLGVLVGSVDVPDGSPYRYAVDAQMRDVVRGTLEPGPWHPAAHALLEDGRSITTRSDPTASQATIDQTRLIAHELRNALVPARHHADTLLRDSALAAERGRLEAIRRGVVRVLDFVDELVQTSELMTEPSKVIEIEDVVRDAVGWLDGADHVELEAAAQPLPIHAPRTRLARALLNVIRNALQAAVPPPRVRVRARRAGDWVELTVDDSGPGVPVAARARIFDDGFTTRPGGSGFGLAFVRRVVEGDLRGRVRYEDSDLGGARFVISLPESKVSHS